MYKAGIAAKIAASKSKKYPRYLLSDKGYDSKRCRDYVTNKGFIQKIPKRGTTGNADTEKKRYIVEHTFGWLDLYRRLILRYDKKINTYSEFTFLALSNMVFNKSLYHNMPCGFLM